MESTALSNDVKFLSPILLEEFMDKFKKEKFFNLRDYILLKDFYRLSKKEKYIKFYVSYKKNQIYLLIKKVY